MFHAQIYVKIVSYEIFIKRKLNLKFIPDFRGPRAKRCDCLGIIHINYE